MESLWGFKQLNIKLRCSILKVLRKMSLDFTIKEHFPDISKLRTRYMYLKMAEDSFKNFVCNELIEECNIDESSFYLQGFEKKYIITMDIEILKKHGLIKQGTGHMSLVNEMLSYLEPFPFDSKYMAISKLQSSSDCLTIKCLRDSIEQQYLAWKYNVDLQQIREILFTFHSGLFICRSLRNLKRNCSILELVPSFRNESLTKKIYLINQQPFSISLVLKFLKCCSYLNWDLISSHGYKIFHHSFSHIYFMIKILKNKGFSSKQIQESVPFLHLNFETFINRMNVILSHPALYRYQNDDNFLHLLLYPTIYLMNLDNSFKSLDELKDFINLMHSKMRLRSKPSNHITISSVKYHASNYFAINSEHLSILKRHPKYSLVTEQQLQSTLRFLKKSKFSKAEVLESIFIILYPRQAIVKALKKIEEAEALNELGFEKGELPEETNLFKAGTKSRQKTLQLCLYYIEKQFNFSWDGVLNLCFKKFKNEYEY